MPLVYVYDPDTNIVTSTATGAINLEQMHAYVSQVLADDSIAPGFIEVVDLEAVTEFKVGYSDMAIFEEVWGKYLQKGCKATIFYAPSDLSYGTFRMLQTVIGLSREDSADRFVVVRSREEMNAKSEHFRS